MKVVHACLSCWYVEGFAYQENDLIGAHVRAGHDVKVVASTEIVSKNGNLTYVVPGTSDGPEGAEVTRLSYTKFLPHVLAKKVRAYTGLTSYLNQHTPDVIFFHGCSAWALRRVARYVRSNPNVVFNVDSHEDLSNSARSRVARLLHTQFYGRVARSVRDVATPVLCVTTTSMEFVRGLYGLRANEVEFFPIGGRILSDVEYLSRRAEARTTFGVSEDDVLFLQSGKMGAAKRLDETLRCFSSVVCSSARLIVAGSIPDEQAESVKRAIAGDSRVTYVGWQSTDSLVSLLCAADVYLQPGSQSATMQASICSRCAVVLRMMPSHEPYVQGNGWLISSEADLRDAIEAAVDNRDQLPGMQAASLQLGRELLDYEVPAERALRKP